MYTLSLQQKFWYLYDRPRGHSSQEILERYIRDAHFLLTSRAQVLMDFNKTFKERDERQLRSMFELLVDARKTWEEEKKES
jgi:hypothetical protein